MGPFSPGRGSVCFQNPRWGQTETCPLSSPRQHAGEGHCVGCGGPSELNVKGGKLWIMLVGGSSCPLPKPRKPVKTAQMTSARDRPARAVERVGGTVQGPPPLQVQAPLSCCGWSETRDGEGSCCEGVQLGRGQSPWTVLLRVPGCLPGAGVTDCRLRKEVAGMPT